MDLTGLPEFVYLDSPLCLGRCESSSKLWCRPISEPWWGSLTVGNANGPSSEPKRGGRTARCPVCCSYGSYGLVRESGPIQMKVWHFGPLDCRGVKALKFTFLSHWSYVNETHWTENRNLNKVNIHSISTQKIIVCIISKTHRHGWVINVHDLWILTTLKREINTLMLIILWKTLTAWSDKEGNPQHKLKTCKYRKICQFVSQMLCFLGHFRGVGESVKTRMQIGGKNLIYSKKNGKQNWLNKNRRIHRPDWTRRTWTERVDMRCDGEDLINAEDKPGD